MVLERPTMVLGRPTMVLERHTMVLAMPTMVLVRPNMVLGRPAMVLGRPTMYSMYSNQSNVISFLWENCCTNFTVIRPQTTELIRQGIYVVFIV